MSASEVMFKWFSEPTRLLVHENVFCERYYMTKLNISWWEQTYNDKILFFVDPLQVSAMITSSTCSFPLVRDLLITEGDASLAISRIFF